MKLKSVKLAGFKSFIDPISIPFTHNLIAVVGPNGCGKSNIIDAVRWVMGESSAKQLRGESMADVIFNGSATRQPLGQASVELIFDNSAGTLGGEYASYTEISIKRKVSRDGQSIYYLNGVACRRRDITDVFLGTGLGPRSYSIIEQGMISRLIEAKPEELRIYLEEAAGISKYKERRRDTENRIRRTQENLARLTDIREELGKQLASLERQAQAAEKYKVFKQEERLLKAQLHGLRWRSLHEQITKQEAHVRELEVKLESRIAAQRSLENQLEQLRHSHMAANDQFNEIQGRYYAGGADIARIEQSIQYQQQRSQQLKDDLEKTTANYQQSQAHLQTDKTQLEVLLQQIETLNIEITQAQQIAEAAQATWLEAQNKMQVWQLDWDNFNQQSSDSRQQVQLEQSDIQHLEQSIQRLQERTQKMQLDLQQFSIEQIEQDSEQLQRELIILDDQSNVLQLQSSQLTQAVEEHKKIINTLLERAHSLSTEIGGTQGRYASLEALQQAALGQKTGAVVQWLEQHQLAAEPRLAEVLEVESGWERAVETVLGPVLQAVCLDDLSSVSSFLAELSQGHLTILDNKATDLPTLSNNSQLIAKVKSAMGIESLLEGVYTVSTLEEALNQRQQLKAKESFITPEGIWIGRNWLRVARDSDQIGMLQRKHELQSLQQQLSECKREEQVTAAELTQQRMQLQTQEKILLEAQQQLTGVQQRQAEVRTRSAAQQVRLEQMRLQRQRIQEEITENLAQLAADKNLLGAARDRLQLAVERMAQDEALRSDWQQQRQQQTQDLATVQANERQTQEQLHHLTLQARTLTAQREAIEQTLERQTHQVSHLAEHCQSLRQALASTEAPIVTLKHELEGYLEQRLNTEKELAAARRQVESLEQQIRGLEQQRGQTEQQVQEVRTELEGYRLECQGLQIRAKTLQEQLQEMGMAWEQVLAELPVEAEELQWETSLTTLTNRINRLGPINLIAIDEFKTQSERKQYLDAQNEDLAQALAALENAIHKIDRETRTRFKETFDKVNSELQRLFPKVFGGGHAYLEMTGDNLLETGIAVMARPPGKRNSTIHLLSGGEKALTAVALVFSIFYLNPAPFCMLDEVDAPLDDANVGRYSNLIKEMSNRVQFIYITHNKLSMEVADNLIGVTMHEPGVSRLVSVNLEEAVEMAAA